MTCLCSSTEPMARKGELSNYWMLHTQDGWTPCEQMGEGDSINSNEAARTGFIVTLSFLFIRENL